MVLRWLSRGWWDRKVGHSTSGAPGESTREGRGGGRQLKQPGGRPPLKTRPSDEVTSATPLKTEALGTGSPNDRIRGSGQEISTGLARRVPRQARRSRAREVDGEEVMDSEDEYPVDEREEDSEGRTQAFDPKDKLHSRLTSGGSRRWSASDLPKGTGRGELRLIHVRVRTPSRAMKARMFVIFLQPLRMIAVPSSGCAMCVSSDSTIVKAFYYELVLSCRAFLPGQATEHPKRSRILAGIASDSIVKYHSYLCRGGIECTIVVQAGPITPAHYSQIYNNTWRLPASHPVRMHTLPCRSCEP